MSEAKHKIPTGDFKAKVALKTIRGIKTEYGHHVHPPGARVRVFSGRD